MIWERPWALALLALLPVLVWLAARSRAPFATGGQRALFATLQAVAWAALAIALAGPWIRAEAEPPTRVVVALPGTDPAAILAWRDATPFAEPFHVVAAGARPVAGAVGDTAVPRATGAPDLAAALRQALLRVPPAGAGDVAILGTAGDAGGPIPPVATAARAANVRLHARTTPPIDPGPLVLAVRHPARVGSREPFRAELDVRAATAAAGTVRITTGETQLSEVPVQIRAGASTLVIEVPPLPRDGVNVLEFALVRAGGVPDPDRQVERTAVLAAGSPRLLWLGASDLAFAALRDTLAPHGLELERGVPSNPFGAAPADAFDAVLVDDLPANAWPEDAQAQLAEAIPANGTGLLIAGAHRSLGPGGYADSPLATVLPVDLPQREERRDPSVAVVLVIDTSGSMGNRVELAKEVARLAIRRLLPHDKVGIVEFYGSKRWAAPLQPASNTIELMRALNRMQAGGGTIIYSALEEGYYALLNVQTRFKHILVLTDGGVESGPFETLARRIASSGINLSTVLIGPQSNSPFLMSLAQWGRGRFYAAPSRFQLPDLRFKEPQTTLMPAVQEKPFEVEASDSESALALADESHTIGGLVEARLRPGAEALVTVSDGGQPVIAGWDQGAGRVTVLATELLGPMADTVRDHGWATLLADQVRALARGRQAARPRLAVDSRPATLRVTLEDSGRAGWPNPVLTLATNGEEPTRVSLTPVGPGTFVTELPWPTGLPLQLGVEGTGIAAAAVRPLPRDHRLRDLSAEVARLAGATDGTVTGPLPPEPPTAPAGPARRPLQPPLTAAAILAFLLSLLVRRWPGAPRAAAALLALALIPTLPAQDPIKERIDAELREVGNFDRLREEWRDGTPEQRLALAHETGDLDTILALTESGELPNQRALRVLALDAKGRLDDALALVGEILAEPDLDDATRAVWKLREGELLAASRGDAREAAAGAFRDAAALVDDPEFRHAVGHLAAGYGFLDVALELHVPPPDSSPSARAATYLRRGLWQERRDDVDGALAEYRAAHDAAPLNRERRFALSRQLALMQGAGRLQELVTDWTERLAELDSGEKAALLDAMRDLEQGEEALELLAHPELGGEPQLQDEALAIAVESGRTEAAVARARARLADDPRQPRLRVSLALLLTDLRQREEARAVLEAGMAIATRRELLLLIEAASELGDEAAFRAGLGVLRGLGEERDELDALLLEFQHLRRRQRNDQAVQLLLDARARFPSPTSKVRLAEALESAGRAAAAIDLYREAHQATQTEDLGLRLAWLLSASGEAEEREESGQLFREIWLNAGSAARRVQAEERVLDLAAREGTLADLAIELEEAVDEPDTEHRNQKREALVKIWARAQDTFGAREVLMQWVRSEPEHEVDAWQRLAQVYLENEEFKNHERALRHLIEIDPAAELDYRQQLALGFLERGRPVEARAVIREMLEGDGSSPDAIAFEFSAGIFSLAGRHREAADLYRRALALHPDRIETLLLWANAMAAQDRSAEAVGRFVDILMQEVADDLFLVAVDGLLNLEAPREVLRFAERALRRRVAVKPDKVFLQRALQDVLEQLGDDAARIASLQETLLVAGLQRTAWLRELMEESARRRDWKAYLGDAKALLRTGDEVPPAVFLEIGEALLKTDELRAAERAFARARLATDFAKVESRIAELFEKGGRIEDAERVRRRVLRRDPTDPTALMAVAQLVEQRGDLADALQLYSDAARRLFEGQDLGAEQPQGRNRGFSRNRTQTGPTWDEALDGVLRCASSAADTEPMRADVAARFAASGDEEPKVRLALLEQLRRIATAWEDDAESGRIRRLEDEVLQSEGVDEDIRLALFEQRVGRGDLDGAEAALAGATEEKARGPRTRLALVRGDSARALELLADANPSALVDAARTLLLLGQDDAVRTLRVRLEALADEDPDSAGSQLDRLKQLLGETVDPRPRMDATLQAAVEAKGELRQRVGRVVYALRNHAFLSDAERGEMVRPLVDEAAREKDGSAAWTILSGAREWLPAEEFAPLVPLLFEDGQQIYLIASRAAFLDILPPDEGAKILRDAFSKFPDTEVRTQILRMLAGGELPPPLHESMLSGLRLNELQPADRTWLTRVCCDAELPEETVDILLRALRRDVPNDPRAAILEARTTDDADLRRRALHRAIPDLAKETQPDYAATQAIERISSLADATLRSEVLGQELPADAPTGALLVRAELLRAENRIEDAADLLAAAALRQPENSLLLNRVQPLLQSLGRVDEAIAIYQAFVEQAAQVYPYQAGQLARLHLEAGRARDALAALRLCEDDSGMNLGLQLRAAVQLDDAEQRAREIRGWVQQVQRSGRRNTRSIVVMGRADDRGARFGPDEVLGSNVVPPIVPRSVDEAKLDGDVLAFVPEGRDAAAALLRGLREEERDQALAVYRGLLGSVSRFGDPEPILARMRERLAAASYDAEALRFVLVAAQIGLPVDGDALERAIVQRATAPRLDADVLIDLLWTARAAGRDQLVARLLPTMLHDRGRLSSYQVRDRVGDVFQLAAGLRPDLLRKLAPTGTSPNAYFDGDLLAVLVLEDSDVVALRGAFAAVPRFLHERSPNHWSARLALPWAGLCARAGDVDGAIDALLVDDPQIENGDLFPPRALAAAAPPLASWTDPDVAPALGARIAEEAAKPIPIGRRGTLLRVGLLLARRLDDAGRSEDAETLRRALAPHVAAVPFVRSWTEEVAR